MAEEGSLGILACQIDIPAMTTASERDRHLRRVADRLRDVLGERPADLVVLPELSSIDYSRSAFAKLDALAEPLDGPSYRCWSRLAREFGVHVVYGFPRRGENDAYHVTTAAVDGRGELLGYYDKLHLAQYGASMEKDYFVAGDHLFQFQFKDFRLAPIICYDIRIPELSRRLAVDHGVDVILHCGAYYRDCSFSTWHDFIVTRAIENQCYVLSLNRAGKQYGNSIFCRPWQDETRPAIRFAEHAEEFRFVQVSRTEIEEVRERFSFLRDRLNSYAL